MFTEEQKIRTIELYFKYGKKLAPSYANWATLRKEICGVGSVHGKQVADQKNPFVISTVTPMSKNRLPLNIILTTAAAAFTSRTLGYPCTDMLARWVNERSPDRRRVFTSKTNPVASFEPEVKRQAVMVLCTRQGSASEIAVRIGVSRAVLYKWKDEIIGNSAYQTMRKHNALPLEAERDALREEVARLNQEIRRRQMELDILKKRRK